MHNPTKYFQTSYRNIPKQAAAGPANE